MTTSTCSNSSLVSVLASSTLQCAHHLHSSSSTVKMGPFDQLVAPSIPIAVVFVYRQSKSAQPILIQRLQRALELLLDYYPHLTGRLHISPTDGSYEITRLGTGAELLIAECSQRLDAFSTSQGRFAVTDLPAGGNALLAPFDPTIESVCRDPLFTIQHTRFACGGVALGLRIYHLLCDADGFFQLARNLAQLYRGLKCAESNERIPKLAHPPQFRSYMSELGDMTLEERQTALEFRPALFHLDPVVLESAAEEAKTTAPNAPPMMGRILHFSSQELEALKIHATDPNGRGTSWVSTFDALSALLYQRIYHARLQHYANSPNLMSPPDFLTPINFRGADRLPDLQPEYFPNALICTYTSLSHDVLAHAPLWQIAKHLHDLTRSGRPNAQHINQTLRWIVAQPDKRRIRQGFRYGSGSLMLSQWTKFDMYAAVEFEEEERPVLVSTPFTPISLLDGLGYFLPTEIDMQGQTTKTCRGTGAIDVNLSLSEPLWEILDRDEQLRRFSSGPWR